MALTASQFSTEISNTTSTGLLLSGNLTFNAGLWKVSNDGTVPVRLTLTSTTASTGGYEIQAGEARDFAVTSSKFALSTTSSSTGDHRRVRLVAVGG